MPVDFLARKAYYLDHLAPVWNAMPAEMRGTLYLTTESIDYAKRILIKPHITEYIEEQECGHNPILTAAYGDAVRAAEFDEGRPVILMEHGVGLTFGKPVYADGYGQRYKLAMFPVPNQHTLDKCMQELRSKPHPIIGVPKLDKWAGEFKQAHPMPAKPTIAIAFHHGDKNSRPGETGSAWEHYTDILPELAKRYKLILHAHPIMDFELLKFYNEKMAQVEFVSDFQEVMRQADIYINDCSSTLYEFCVTGKPVIILNAPWFDKKSNWGIRFWEYTDIGIQVDDPGTLIQAIDETIQNPEACQQARRRAVEDLFPYLGTSADRAVSEIKNFLQTQTGQYKMKVTPTPNPNPPAIAKIDRKPARKSMARGLLYMCFGKKAMDELKRSIESLRSVGSDLPICVVGSNETIAGMNGSGPNVRLAIHWTGTDPYDASMIPNFQFRAGRIKPGLYDLSPFEETLYVDCDVEFKADPEPGFGYLKNWDIAIAQERLAINELYNRPRANWQHNVEERDATIKAFGGDGNFPFLNSGVIFFRKNKDVEDLFGLWSDEWKKWQMWDEQASLLRALNRSKVRLMILSEYWNFPHDGESKTLILHQYGMGAARSDVEE